jgi:hypothetical protein
MKKEKTMKQQHKFNWRSLISLLFGLVLGLAGYLGLGDGLISPAAAAGPDHSLVYAGDLPIAADVQTFSYDVASKQLNYTSPSTVEALAAFYRQALLAQGWQENWCLSTYGNGLALIRFKQDESSLTVNISNSGSTAATEVSIRTHCVVWLAEGMDQLIYAEDLPIAADAQALSYNAAFKQIDYSSPSTVESLAAFYRQALLAQGWQENRFFSTYGNGLALVRFKQGESSLSVHISNSDSAEASEVTLLTHCVKWSDSLDSVFYAANPELMVVQRYPTAMDQPTNPSEGYDIETLRAQNYAAITVMRTGSTYLAANPEVMVARRYSPLGTWTLEAFLQANPEMRFVQNRLAGVREEPLDSAFLAANPELMAAHRYAASEILTLGAFLGANPE